MATNFELAHTLETMLAKLGVSNDKFSSIFTDSAAIAINHASKYNQINGSALPKHMFIFHTTNLNLSSAQLELLITELVVIQDSAPNRINTYRIIRYYSKLYIIYNENIVYKDISCNNDRCHLIRGNKFDLHILSLVETINHTNEYMQKKLLS